MASDDELTEEQIEDLARDLWEQRERSVLQMWGIKSTPWEEATEPGKELMRRYARAGQTHWLDSTELPPDDEEEEELTEEAVEGIYVENQYKLENIPGFADAFQRMSKYMRKVFQGDKLTAQEEQEFQQALADAFMAEAKHRYGLDQK